MATYVSRKHGPLYLEAGGEPLQLGETVVLSTLAGSDAANVETGLLELADGVTPPAPPGPFSRVNLNATDGKFYDADGDPEEPIFDPADVLTGDGLEDAIAATDAVTAKVDKADLRTSVKEYGVVGNGSTNDLTAWQAALDAAVPLLVPNGCLSKITGSHLQIPVTGADILWEPGSGVKQYTNHGIFKQTGSLGSPVGIDSGGTLGSAQIVADGLTGVTVGDWLLLTSEDADSDGCKRGFLRLVTDIPTTDTYSLHRSLPVALTTTPRVRQATIAEQVRMTGPGALSHATPSTQTDTSGGGIHLTLSNSPEFDGIDVGDLGTAGITLVSCVGGHADRVSIHDLMDVAGSSHFGYAFNVAGATIGFQVRSGSATRCRHGFTTSGSSANYGEPEACQVHRAYVVSGTSNTGLDTHQQGYGTILDGTVIGCPWGINDRAKATRLAGIVEGCGQQDGTTATTVGGRQGVGVNLLGADAHVTTAITNMAAAHYGCIRVGATASGTKLAPTIPSPVDGEAVVYQSAALVTGGLIEGTRTASATYETQVVGGAAARGLSAADGYMVANAANGSGSGFRVHHGGVLYGALAKSTDGTFLNLELYNGSGTFTGYGLQIVRSTGRAAFSGPIVRKRRAVTASTTATTADDTIAITTASAGVVVTLPAAASFGAGATLRVADEGGIGGTYAIALGRAGSDTINGATSYTLPFVNYTYAEVVSDGTSKWTVIAKA